MLMLRERDVVWVCHATDQMGVDDDDEEERLVDVDLLMDTVAQLLQRRATLEVFIRSMEMAPSEPIPETAR